MAHDHEALEQLVAGDPTAHLTAESAEVRRLAVAACRRLGAAIIGVLGEIVEHDPDEHVRAEAVEVLGTFGSSAFAAVAAATGDDSTRVLEAVATALGEIADPRAMPWLLQTIESDTDPLIREAAIAATGALGDKQALPILLDIVRTGRPQLRRRAVVALTAFDGPEVEAAFAAARLDRNPMVREVAEMVIGRAGPGA